MYLVIDKSTDELLWTNPAPLEQGLKGKDVWYEFDSNNHRIIEVDVLPSHYKIENGAVKELTLKEKVDAGIINQPDFTKIEDNEFVQMTLQDKVDAGLIEIPEGMKVENDNFVEMTNAEKVVAGLMTQEEADNAEKERLIQQKIQELNEANLRQQAIDELVANGTISQ